MTRRAQQQLRKIAVDRLADVTRHGQRFWIGTDPQPGQRRIIRVTDLDAAKITALQRGPSDEMVTVRDLKTNENVTVRRASCGLPRCFCALEFVN